MKEIKLKAKFILFLFWLVTPVSFLVSQDLPKESSLNSLNFLDSTLSEYKVFISAEIHWMEENSNRKKMIIEYLSSRNSLDKIILEQSYSFGNWINHFIDTGDTLFLKDLLANYHYSTSKNKIDYVDDYNFYKWLRTYIIENKLSFRIEGIDLEYVNDPKPILWSFLKYTSINFELQKVLQSNIVEANDLMNKEKVSIATFKKWFSNLEKSINNKMIVNDSFLSFVFNIKQSIPFARGAKMDYREKQLLENFKKHTSSDEKIFGQFGLPHVTLKEGKRTALKSFVSILNSEEEYRGNILSFGLVCFNCKMADFPEKDYYEHILTKDEYLRLKPEYKNLTTNTIVDLRQTDELIKEYVQLLLVVHN